MTRHTILAAALWLLCCATPIAAQAPVFTPEEAEARRLRQHMALADDWANLERYRAANAALAPAAPDERRVVFFGDSITEIWPTLVPGFFSGKPWIGRGISGQTTPQMLVRFRQDVVALKPAVVVILAGTNDISGKTGPATPAMIQDNLMSMTDIARANGIRVVLSSILPAKSYYWAPRVEPVATITAVNAWMRAHARKEGLGYIDYHTPLAADDGGLRPELGPDGVHPNEKGFAVMAPLAEEAIARALGSDPPIP
jgi:acyl-CoA thioesterase I